MQFRLIAAALVATASIASTSPSLASPPPFTDESISEVGALRTQLRYTFEQRATYRAGSFVRDVSRFSHSGRVRSAASGKLAVVQRKRGQGVSYPARCAGCRHRKAIIEARDRASLDPSRRSFLFGVVLKVTAREARGDANIVQKGSFKQSGGQYKLQLNDGVPGCVIRGGRGRVFATSVDTVANGRWHSLRCRRTPRAVILKVDGQVAAKTFGRTGRIANEAPLRVGGHNLNPRSDQYHGDLDNVYLRIRR